MPVGFKGPENRHSTWMKKNREDVRADEPIARAARLRMPVERAVALIHAVGVGAVTTLLAIPEEERDPQLSSVLGVR